MKRIGFISFFLLSFFGLVSAYENQGFTTYQEIDGNIEFQCDNQCFVLIGNANLGDYIDINGSAEGNGILGYGFLQGQEILPGGTIQINQIASVNQKFNFQESPYRSQLQKNIDTQIMLVIQGNVRGKINSQLGELGVIDSFSQSWKSFWQNEPLSPYSINLRYGVKIGGKSIVGIGYFIFFILLLLIVVFGKGDKKKKYYQILYLGIGIFLFIGVRNLITYTGILNRGLTNYTNQNQENKIFFDLGDYITFTDKVRKSLNLDIEKNKKCSIYVNSIQERPFNAHRKVLYLKPCNLVLTGNQADYTIYYKTPINFTFQREKLLVEYNGSYLLSNK